MANYIDLLLVKPEEGAPVLVEAPISTAIEGDIVFFTQEDYGTVIRSEWLVPAGPIYAMISEATTIYPARKVYSCHCKWEEQENEEVADGEISGDS